MLGPHGLYLIRFKDNPSPKWRPQIPPLEVVETIGADTAEAGVRTVFFNVVDQTDLKGGRNVYADAFCDFVEFDYETRDAAAQWLLDYCNVKYGG